MVLANLSEEQLIVSDSASLSALSLWNTLRIPLFRAFWIASATSNVGW